MSFSKIVRTTLLATFALVLSLAAADAAQAVLVCEGTSNGGSCEAAPQGEGFLYFFGASGRAFLDRPLPPTSPFRTYSCIDFIEQPGKVRVIVTGPNGFSADVTRNVCPPPPGEGEPTLPL